MYQGQGRINGRRTLTFCLSLLSPISRHPAHGGSGSDPTMANQEGEIPQQLHPTPNRPNRPRFNPPNAFDGNAANWPTWRARFRRFAKVSDLKTEDKVPTFLLSMGGVADFIFFLV